MPVQARHDDTQTATDNGQQTTDVDQIDLRKIEIAKTQFRLIPNPTVQTVINKTKEAP